MRKIVPSYTAVELQHPEISWLEHVCIRKLVKTDLPALEWEGEYTHFRRLYQQVYHSMAKGEAQMWGVELSPYGLIGQMFVQLVGGRKELADGVTRAYIYSFRIRTRYRSLGIGSYFLKWVEADLIKKRFKWLTLNVARNNSAARRFYERNGYQIVASEPGQWSYYDHNGVRRQVDEPAWRMQKTLIPN
jgi:ribosomal protein S18 acetylase RimI-like enzyme